MKKLLLVHETFGRLAGAEQNIMVTAPRLREEFVLSCLYWKRSGRDEAAFEALFTGQPMGRLGSVTQSPALTLRRGSVVLCDEPAEALAQAFKVTLNW